MVSCVLAMVVLPSWLWCGGKQEEHGCVHVLLVMTAPCFLFLRASSFLLLLFLLFPHQLITLTRSLHAHTHSVYSGLAFKAGVHYESPSGGRSLQKAKPLRCCCGDESER